MHKIDWAAARQRNRDAWATAKCWEHDGWCVTAANDSRYLLSHTFAETRAESIKRFMEHFRSDGPWKNLSRRIGVKCVKAHLQNGWYHENSNKRPSHTETEK